MGRIKELAKMYDIETTNSKENTIVIDGQERPLTEDNIEHLFPINRRFAPDWIDTLQKNEIIVVGTNWKGIHGAGAAKYAFDHYGLSWGRSLGQFGQSFGIPTKDFAIKSLPLDEIGEGINFFIGFSQTNFGKKFKYKVTSIGTGYAGYTAEQIAPMFKEAFDKENIYLPKSFIDVLQS